VFLVRPHCCVRVEHWKKVSPPPPPPAKALAAPAGGGCDTRSSSTGETLRAAPG
jgi:hypothetical protein